jgi:glyoxylase-like metal-dependent hydrolase (beta-lactamase superfamily II)
MLTFQAFPLGPLATNAYLVTDAERKRAVVIDPGTAHPALLRRMENFEVEAVLLTHAHFDHIGGVEELRRRKRCPVYLHDAEREWLTDPAKSGSTMWREYGGPAASSPPDHGLVHGQKLTLVGETFEVFHTPGHSPGSCSLLLGDKVFAGDVLFRQSVGRTDLLGGSFAELYRSIHDHLFKLPDETVVYPGHGPSTTIGFEKANNPYV